MAHHQRILLLGTTGVDKRQAADRLADYLKRNHGEAIRYIDFDKDILPNHLPGAGDWTTFLWQQPFDQHRVWMDGWLDLRKKLRNMTGVVVLGLHATYVSGVVGLRSAIDIPQLVKDFKPTLIVNLIDDVYSAWRRTEDRADGREDLGRPTFEQLLVARRAEQYAGDIVLTHTGDRQARHVVYAMQNSVAGLANLILSNAKITYLSFPISEPRELAREGKPEFTQLIDRAHGLALQKMKGDISRVFVSPLSIDELPLVIAFNESDAPEVDEDQDDYDRLPFSFDTSRRWDSDTLWGERDATLTQPLSGLYEFRLKQIKDARGVIATDVGWRDRRLVLQSKSLAVVSPKPPLKDLITRGVREEVALATSSGITCAWWQNPDWDPNDFVGKSVFRPAGSMGIGQTEARTPRVETLEKLIDFTPP